MYDCASVGDLEPKCIALVAKHLGLHNKRSAKQNSSFRGQPPLKVWVDGGGVEGDRTNSQGDQHCNVMRKKTLLLPS